MRILRAAITATVLALIWLVAFRIADLFTVFKTYSSVWFLPAGVTLAVVLAAPGWLKLVPLFAHLSLALPQVRQILHVEVASTLDALLHACRIYLIYGGIGLFLARRLGNHPYRGWVEVQWFLGASLIGATLATIAGLVQSILLGELDLYSALALSESWWMGDALGAVMVPPMLVPAILAAYGRPLGGWRWPGVRTFAMQALALALASLIGASGPSFGLNLWYTVLPPVILFALRGGFEQAAASALLTCFITPAIALAVTGTVDVANLPALLLTMAVAALLIGSATTERQQAAARLEALVVQRTKELAKAYDVQRHLVRTLGHDLRQPVEAINLTVASIGEHSDGEARRTALNRVRQLGALTSDLLTRILTYARLDTGDVRAEYAPVSLARLMGQLRATYDPQAERRRQTLLWPETDRIILSDRDLLFQIFSNYLDNAVRLTPEGGTVEVKIEESAAGTGIFVIDGVEPTTPHHSSRGGLGLRIVSEASRLIGATVVDDQNRKGVIVPLKR